LQIPSVICECDCILEYSWTQHAKSEINLCIKMFEEAWYFQSKCQNVRRILVIVGAMTVTCSGGADDCLSECLSER
jgi:hypothetical protein